MFSSQNGNGSRFFYFPIENFTRIVELDDVDEKLRVTRAKLKVDVVVKFQGSVEESQGEFVESGLKNGR